MVAFGLAVLLAVHMLFFGIRSTHLLGYPYPLDYGEGPLLAQVQALRDGMPIWRLYADPDQPPYAVVNYPPVYILMVAALDALLPGSALLAGRIVSLLAALSAALALALLVSGSRGAGARERKQATPFSIQDWPSSLLTAGLFLSIGIVREWASVMRVDMLGLSLGLWALLVVQRSTGRRGMLWAAPLLALSLLCKPTLLAAPAAVGLWLLFRSWRWALALGMLTALLVGLSVSVLQFTSAGWFIVHTLLANANAWDGKLAQQFWQDHMLIMRPLMLAGIVALLVGISGRKQSSADSVFTIHHTTKLGAALHALWPDDSFWGRKAGRLCKLLPRSICWPCLHAGTRAGCKLGHEQGRTSATQTLFSTISACKPGYSGIVRHDPDALFPALE